MKTDADQYHGIRLLLSQLLRFKIRPNSSEQNLNVCTSYLIYGRLLPTCKQVPFLLAQPEKQIFYDVTRLCFRKV